MDVASFLLNCTATLPNAEEISALLLGGGDDEDDEEEDDDVNADKHNSEISIGANTKATIPDASVSVDTEPKTSSCCAVSPQNDNDNSVEVSCINPRGKFLLYLDGNACVLTNPKLPQEQIRFSAANVEHVVWFRKPEDYKKLKQLNSGGGGNGKMSNTKDVPGHMVLICLGEGIMFRNKALKQVCLQLPSYPHPSTTKDESTDVTGTDEVNNKIVRTEKYWWNTFSNTLLVNSAKGGIIRVPASMDKPEFLSNKNNFVFCSEGESGRTTTTEAMPYVGCYQGFNDGALFPLREGLLFFKPPMFVPRSKLTSISCGRGSGGSRFVDMVAQLDADPALDEEEGKKSTKQSDTLEFTNIHRDELNGLNDYIHRTLIPAMQLDADGVDEAVAGAVNSNDYNRDDGSKDDGSYEYNDADVAVAEVVHSSDDDGDENNATETNELDQGIKRRRPSRAAAKSAREITRAALMSATTGGDGDSDDSVEFQEEDDDSSDGSEDTDGSDDQTDVSDGDSSSEGEGGDPEEDEMDDSDYDQKKKKAKVG